MGALKRLFNLATNFRKIHSDILDNAGTIAVTEFKGNFRKQGFNGKGWEPRKKSDKDGKSRLILVKTGKLRRGIRKGRKTINSITIENDVRYAKIHNEGGQIKHSESMRIISFSNKWGRSLFAKTGTRKDRSSVTHQSRSKRKSFITIMPKRQFMGDMPSIRKKVKAMIKRKMKALGK